MAKKHQLTPDEVTELFSELDESGVLDPNRVRSRQKRMKARSFAQRTGDAAAIAALDEETPDAAARSIDPLSGADPSGSRVDHTITRTAVAFLVLMLALVLGLQIWYGVNRRLNTANLSETVNTQTVSTALEGGLEWGNGFTQFPRTFTVNQADERSGVVEVSVLDTDSANELELFSNSQIQAAALATNALLNDHINQVVYNVAAMVDDDGNITQASLFGLIPAQGSERTIFTFVWTKHKSEESSNIDWELRIIGMDEEIAGRIQEQVNSVSSLIEDPGVSQDDIEAQAYERELEQQLKGSEVFTGGAPEKSVDDLVPDDTTATPAS